MAPIEQAFDEQAFDADLGAFVPPIWGTTSPPLALAPPLNTWGSPPSTLRRSPPIAAKATLPLDAAERLRRGLREALRDGDHVAARELASTLRAFPHHFAYKEVSQ